MLKKLSLIIAISLFASSAFAGTIDTSLVKGFSPSNKVDNDYTPDAAKTVYGVSTKHQQGNKTFGSTSASSLIWYSTKATGNAAGDALTNKVAAPQSASDSTVQTDWSAM